MEKEGEGVMVERAKNTFTFSTARGDDAKGNSRSDPWLVKV